VSPAGPRKLVLAVIDGMKPAALERAMQTGQAPVLQAMAERQPGFDLTDAPRALLEGLGLGPVNGDPRDALARLV